MSIDSNGKHNDPVKPPVESIPVPGRRRLLQGGLGAAPVLMTLVSRPVLGGTSQCFTPSGSMSMPTSQDRQPQFCQGRTPGFWKQEQKFPEWPGGFYPKDVVNHKGKVLHTATLFGTYFSPVPAGQSASTFTLLEALSLMAGPPNDVVRHIAAALLNAAKGWTPVLTEASLKIIWHEYISTGGGLMGYYVPVAGEKWYHDEITEYLESTQKGG
jgi:hypothetical protein